MRPERAGKIGRSLWFALPVSDLADAMSFYEGLLGWTYRQMEESPLIDYVMVEAGGELIGGLRSTAGKPFPRAGESASPVLYFSVENLEDKVIRAKELGAEIVGTMVDLGRNRGRYQWIRDRTGNLIGLWGPR
jgi:predicted enzyme related to lactoylglutathione lyase